MDIEYILNDALNKALCGKDRIKKPNSNNIAEFVDDYLSGYYTKEKEEERQRILRLIEFYGFLTEHYK